MVKEKNKTIKTADFEAEVRKLEQDINDTKYITKTAVLRAVEEFRTRLIRYEPIEEISIPKFLKGAKQ